MILSRQVPSLLKNALLINRNVLNPTNQSWYFHNKSTKYLISNKTLIYFFYRTIFHRTIAKNIKKPLNLKEEKFKLIDKISDSYTLIYKAPMDHYLTFCKHFTMFSFVAIGGVSLYKYCKDLKLVDMDFNSLYNNLTTSDAEVIGFVIGFFIFNIVIRVMLNKYPLRIYKNNSQLIRSNYLNKKN